MKRFLLSIGQLLLIWLAIIVALASAALVLTAMDPLKDVPYVSARGAA